MKSTPDPHPGTLQEIGSWSGAKRLSRVHKRS
jgi:hypothetical protein